MRSFSWILRWAARISALLIVGGYVVLVIGEFVSPHSGPPTSFQEWAGIVLLSVACLATLVAWRWELAGALVSLIALGLFVWIISVREYTIFAAVALPGILFLADWATRRFNPQRA